MQLKILLVSTSSGSRGGGEIFLRYLGEGIRRAGHNVALWCSSHQRMDELAKSFSPIGKVIREDYRNSYLDRKSRSLGAWQDRKTANRIASCWTEFSPDVIHLNKQTTEDGLDLVAAAKITDIPSLATVHLTQSNRQLGSVGAPLRDWVARRAMNQAREISLTAVSDARAKELSEQLDRQVDVVYNGVEQMDSSKRGIDRQLKLKEFGWDEDCIVVACVARLVQQKNPQRFLRLARAMYSREPRFRFLWIGDGEMRGHFESKVRAMNLAGIVACTGWLSDPSPLFQISELYLHPAAYEGLPLAILEAMSAGIPCILSPEIAGEATPLGDSSIIKVHEDCDDWLNKICDSEFRKACGRRARQIFEEHFTIDQMAKGYIARYQSVLTGFDS